MEISKETFLEAIESFRTPHLWEKRNGKWKLSSSVWSKRR